jgi:hypothetical protein
MQARIASVLIVAAERRPKPFRGSNGRRFGISDGLDHPVSASSIAD